MVHRDRFDRTLAARAVEAGAHLLPGVRVLGREGDGTVIARQHGGAVELRIKASVVIGADGPRSTVGRWVGAVNRNLLPGVQVTVPLREECPYAETYFEPEFFGGYGWFFPKKDRVNIGLGMRRPLRPESLGGLLDRFVAGFVRRGRVEDRILARAGGWIPAEPLRRGVHGNVLLAGDAAGQTHPITGAGIFAAVVCGRMAGTHAAGAALTGNLALLEGYDADWQGLFGKTLTRATERRAFMESAWHDFGPTIRRSWVAFREYYAR
jgi:flavin-dependent dehydrogenase